MPNSVEKFVSFVAKLIQRSSHLFAGNSVTSLASKRIKMVPNSHETNWTRMELGVVLEFQQIQMTRVSNSFDR